MRRLAVAADGGMGGLDPNHTTLLGWLGGLATATIGAIGLWLAQRVLGKAAFQQAINDGFSKLTQDLQEERDKAREALTALETRFAQAQIDWAARQASLEGQVRNLTQANESLRHLLQRHGISIPEPSPAAPISPALIIEKPKGDA